MAAGSRERIGGHQCNPNQVGSAASWTRLAGTNVPRMDGSMDAERYSAQLEGESNLAPSATVSSVSCQPFHLLSLPFACTVSCGPSEWLGARGWCVGVRPTTRTLQPTVRAPTGGTKDEMVFLLNSHRTGGPPSSVQRVLLLVCCMSCELASPQYTVRGTKYEYERTRHTRLT